MLDDYSTGSCWAIAPDDARPSHARAGVTVVGPWLAGSLLMVTCLLPGGWGSDAGAADEIEAELVGFLVQLPRDGLRLPPTSTATATLEVPNELGGPRVVFPVEFNRQTGGTFRASHVRSGDLVVLQGVLRGARMLVLQIRDVDVAEFKGRLSLPDGPVALPLTADRLVDVLLDGTRLPVSFLLTPRTTAPRTTLRDGQPVSLAVVVGGRVVVDLETTGPR